MSETIAVAGKGGTGKTTLCGFLIDWLCKTGKTPVLAVDADANSNLNEVLGVEADITLGQIREQVISDNIPAGISKQDYMDCKFADALIEEDDFDMLIMGRTEGKGCYCFVNSLLQNQLNKLSGAYKYVVVDNEAGMEHISRGILPSVDYFLLVSDCSKRGVQAVGRIAALIDQMGIKPKKTKLIVNRAPDGKLDDGVIEEIKLQGLDLLGVVPGDEMVYAYDCAGKPTSKLGADTAARGAFEKFIGSLFE